MERKYFSINEEMARQAHEMMSFTEYKKGRKTAEYKAAVDEVYDLAERAAKVRPEEAERIFALADRYAKRLAENMNKDSEIGCRCPSVMISGAGNFPTGKKQKQVAAWDRNYAEYDEIQKIPEKIRSIIRGKDIIKSGDKDAVQKLENKLAKLRKTQEKMVAANKAIRMKDTAAGDAKLKELGFSDGNIAELRKPDFMGRVGFPSYALSNNNANIHRIEGRIKELQAAKETGTAETTTEHCRVVENTEQMRLQVLFDGKPAAEVRNVMKANGFRWAPSNGCWQRQLTASARSAMRRVECELDKVFSAE